MNSSVRQIQSAACPINCTVACSTQLVDTPETFQQVSKLWRLKSLINNCTFLQLPRSNVYKQTREAGGKRTEVLSHMVLFNRA